MRPSSHAQWSCSMGLTLRLHHFRICPSPFRQVLRHHPISASSGAGRANTVTNGVPGAITTTVKKPTLSGAAKQSAKLPPVKTPGMPTMKMVSESATWAQSITFCFPADLPSIQFRPPPSPFRPFLCLPFLFTFSPLPPPPTPTHPLPPQSPKSNRSRRRVAALQRNLRLPLQRNLRLPLTSGCSAAARHVSSKLNREFSAKPSVGLPISVEYSSQVHKRKT